MTPAHPALTSALPGGPEGVRLLGLGARAGEQSVCVLVTLLCKPGTSIEDTATEVEPRPRWVDRWLTAGPAGPPPRPVVPSQFLNV